MVHKLPFDAFFLHASGTHIHGVGYYDLSCIQWPYARYTYRFQLDGYDITPRQPVRDREVSNGAIAFVDEQYNGS